MQIYAFPEEIISVPSFDYNKPDISALQQREEHATGKLKKLMQQKGWTGPNTGEVYGIPMADGHARYMVIEGPAGSRKFALVHLPFGDAWHSPFASRVTKADVLKTIKGTKKLARIFANTTG